jgi:ATP-dependent Lon protease
VNPVFLLDEVDKMSMDFRGDPSSALLEVLDPEQNHSFVDHYLDAEYDLSKVMFIATANVVHPIPPALKDRMEIITLSGYTPNEKVAIARQFLVKKQVKENGLKADQALFEDGALYGLIEKYTREAGVRSLEREIAAICRKVARKKATLKKARAFRIVEKQIPKFLGVPKYLDSQIERRSRIGVATGLAWTEAGGDLLNIEVSILAGTGVLMLTGKLGETMRESGQAALSYARSRATSLGLDKNFYKGIDVHVHLPEGAIPKDGPSAGISIATALVSALTGVPTREDVAMTGEITLLGNVLPIGGLNEKVVAAKRAGVKTVIIPKLNEKDLQELPDFIRDAVDFRLVETMDEVLEVALKPGDSSTYLRRNQEEQQPPQPYTH